MADCLAVVRIYKHVNQQQWPQHYKKFVNPVDLVATKPT
jgi:hypothetical protein